MNRLGVALLKGELGLKRDAETAVKWIKRAASCATKEYSGGKYEYAVLHEKGLYPVISEDHVYMLSLLEEACVLGNPDARNFR